MDLSEVSTVFSAHNRSRIERLIELAPPTHQTFLQLLPLIFQSNDPALPCYVEGAPFGIVDYQPSDNLLAIAKKHHPKLTYKKHAFRHYSLQGLYLINDAGALNYPAHPYYELWLVYSSANSDDETTLLKTKLHDVINVAKSLGIKINARLLNDAAIKEHTIASDDLDRFYNSGLVLAGCTPLWWLIPPEQEQDYLQQAQQLTASPPAELSLLDFGPLTNRSASELVDSAIRASLNTLELGLPNYIDLFFQQTLLDNFSDNLWLSYRYKQAVYNTRSNTFFCEPSLLKYHVVSEKIAPDLLPYLKQSLYCLANERLSINVKSPRFPWRRENMADLVSEWQWNNQDLVVLDHRSQAQIRQCLDEFQLTQKLVYQLNTTISDLAKHSVPDAAKKVVALQTRCRNIFDCPPDVIPRLPAKLIPEISEDFLFVEFDATTQQWTINELARVSLKKNDSFTPLYSSSSLLRSVAWAIINGALSKHTRIKLIAHNSDVATNTLYSLVEHLLKSPLTTEVGADEDLIWLLFANTDQTPQEAYKQQDIKLSVRLRDPLNYGYHRRNTILCLEVLVCSHNGQWHHSYYDDKNAVGETLASFIRWQSNGEQHNYIDCWCPTPFLANGITKRITSLCQHFSEHFHQYPENGIYILEVGDHLCRLQWLQNQQVETTRFARRYDLDTVLSLARDALYITHVDAELDPEGLYRLLFKEQNKQHIRIFLDSHSSYIDVYILDELGHLAKQRHTSLNESTLLTNLNQFITAIPSTHQLDEPHFYKLTNHYGEWSFAALALPQVDAKASYLPVRVTMEQAKVDANCTIICGHKQFKGKANDAALFQQVSQLILSLRKSSHSFALYITELTFEQTIPIATTHDHLVFKQHLENLLNNR